MAAQSSASGSGSDSEAPTKKKKKRKKTQKKNKALASVETLASKSPGLAGGLVVPSAQVRQRARHERATDAEHAAQVSAAPKSSRKSTEGQHQAHKGHRLREARDGRRWTVALRHAREMSGAGPAGPKMRTRRPWGPKTAAAVRRRWLLWVETGRARRRKPVAVPFARALDWTSPTCIIWHLWQPKIHWKEVF